MKLADVLTLPSQKRIALLSKWNDAYRQGSSLVPDTVYDQVFDSLTSDEQDEFGIGFDVASGSRKTKLPIPMYSMNKVKTMDEIEAWKTSKGLTGEEEILITPKYDGLSFVLEYGSDNSWTRGDGILGQKSNAHFNELSKTKEFGSSTILDDNHIIGEVIMKRSSFDSKYANKPVMRGGKCPKNPRNFIAGMFNADDPTPMLQDVEFVCYGVGDEFGSKLDMIKTLNVFNTVKVPYKMMKLKDLTHEFLELIYLKWNDAFEIDGVIIEFNDVSLRTSIGREKNNNPGYARAYKFQSEIKDTIIKNIEWNISKEGKLCPVANLEPIELGGVTISRVTCINARFVENNKLEAGVTVGICRSGDVIPKIMSVNGNAVII
jgi:DNA ligase (NAD+)